MEEKRQQRCIKTISLSEKLKIIQCFKQGQSRSELMEAFGVPRSTLCRILTNAGRLEEEGGKRHGQTKRLKRPGHPKLEECLMKWVELCASRNVPLSGQMLKRKAGDFAQSLGIEGFGASNGWLAGFKKRNAEISFNKMFTGVESCTALDMDMCYSWMPPLEQEQLVKDEQVECDEPKIIFTANAEEITDFSGSESSLQPINLCGISISEEESKTPTKRPRRRSRDESEEHVVMSSGDKFSLWAKVWENKLRELSPDQVLHAEKLINEVLYEASLGNLSRKCSINIPTLNQNS